jgi:phosphatidylserine/phosphatidylglycerophosphate/cardiolipin synthase-like enzyme
VKLVVADDHVLTGSHNWSGGAFEGQVQDSVMVTSPDLAAYLSAVFETQWSAAAGDAR